MRIRIYLDRCIGAGECVRAARAVFGLNAQGKAEVIDPGAAGDASILRAAESCPTRAIFLWDEAGKPRFPPGQEGK